MSRCYKSGLGAAGIPTVMVTGRSAGFAHAFVEDRRCAPATDSKYREVDLAIDWNEEVSLFKNDADHVVRLLSKAGFLAVRSSVHINFGPPHFDKLSACMT